MNPQISAYTRSLIARVTMRQRIGRHYRSQIDTVNALNPVGASDIIHELFRQWDEREEVVYGHSR